MTKTTYRNAKKEKYTPISNSLLWDKEASLQAKGLLSIFLSNSADWELNMKEIINRSKNGRDAHYKVVNELIELGYFARVQVMNPIKRQFEEMIYIFSDIKQEVVDEIENIKQWSAANGKDLIIEYKTNKKATKEPHPENQDTAKNPVPDFQDAEEKKSANQYINNTNLNNTNLNNTNKNLNPNLNEANIYDLLWDTKIPSRLKIRIKILLQNQSINLSPEQILLIEDAYLYQTRKSYVVPDCADDDITALNDYEFSATVEKMLKTVKKIDNIRGLIKSWVKTAYDYKCCEQYVGDFSSNQTDSKLPFYDWLND